MTTRHVIRTIRAMETSDGAGVRIRRSLGRNQAARLDPFLMLIEQALPDCRDGWLASAVRAEP